MHTSVDSTVDNAAAWLGLFRGAAGRVGGQVQPRPAAVDELAEVAGEPLLEVVVLSPRADGPLDAGDAVHAERHRPHLPAIPLRIVVPALHGCDLPCAGVAGDRLAVGPLPFRAARVRARARGLPVGRLERVEDERPRVGGVEPPGFLPLAQPAAPRYPGPDRGADVGGEADRGDPG